MRSANAVVCTSPAQAAALPVKYEQAVAALIECQTIAAAKYWDHASEALKALAAINRDKRALAQARRLKLLSYRRMGELAAQIRPTVATSKGSQPGPYSLLIEHGLTPQQAGTIRNIARMPQKQFDEAVALPRPPTPVAIQKANGSGSKSWHCFGSGHGLNATSFRGFCRKYKARDLARGLAGDEVVRAREMAQECADWLDEFLQYLPKEKK